MKIFGVRNDEVRMKSQQSFSMYMGNEKGWVGSLNTLNAGSGYMYKSTGTLAQTLTYPALDRSEMLLANITAEKNHWIPNVHQYPDNMSMMSVVEIDSIEQRSENVEVGAFCNGECRGSAKLMYVPSTDRYIAFMTVYGENNDRITFKLFDLSSGIEYSEEAIEEVVFAVNEVTGTPETPFVLHFGRNITDIEEQYGKTFVLYPNPVERGQNVYIDYAFTNEEMENMTIEIINGLGEIVSVEKPKQHPIVIRGLKISGLYTVKVKTGKNSVYIGKLVVF